jgi:hypothetical protein
MAKPSNCPEPVHRKKEYRALARAPDATGVGTATAFVGAADAPRESVAVEEIT